MTLGKYTVRTGLRADNPAFPLYLVFIGERLIGKQFSMPSITDCEWLERHNGHYAEKSAPCRRHTAGGGSYARNASKPNGSSD